MLLQWIKDEASEPETLGQFAFRIPKAPLQPRYTFIDEASRVRVRVQTQNRILFEGVVNQAKLDEMVGWVKGFRFLPADEALPLLYTAIGAGSKVVWSGNLTSVQLDRVLFHLSDGRVRYQLPLAYRGASFRSRGGSATLYGHEEDQPVNPKLQWLSQGPGGVHASCANCQGTVCLWCWGVPEFEQCKVECEQQFAGDPGAISRCVCQRCVNDDHCGGVGTRDRQAYGWMVKSDETCIHQDEVNAVLRANGYNQITRDCILGPLTCGASRVATDIDSSVGIPSPCFQHQSEWRMPTKVGQAPPAPVATKKKGSGGALLILASLVGLAAYGYANS